MTELQGVTTRETAVHALPAGASFAVDTAAMVASDCAMVRLRRQVFDALANGVPVGLGLHRVDTGSNPADDLARLCGTLAAAVTDAAAAPSLLELTIPAGWLPPGDALAIRREFLGDGVTWLRTEAATFLPARDTVAAAEAFWHDAWQLRDACELACTFADVSGSASPLLSTQRACTVLPPLALQCPAGTAWARVPLDLSRCADADGRIDMAELTHGVESVIDAGERLHDVAVWPTAAMREDSWRNRRVAIVLTGLGDIAVRMGRWPADRHCIQVLTGVLRSVRRIAVDRSRELAHSIGMLPALHEHDPAPKLGAAAQPAWRARWARALAAVGTRHRNLVTMSPASLLPTGMVLDRSAFELLPLLEHADTWCLPPISLLKTLNLNDYIELHRLCWAVLQRRNGRRLVAEQV